MKPRAVPHIRLVALPGDPLAGGAAAAAEADPAGSSTAPDRASAASFSEAERPLGARLADGWLFDETKDLEIGGVEAGVFDDPQALDETAALDGAGL